MAIWQYRRGGGGDVYDDMSILAGWAAEEPDDYTRNSNSPSSYITRIRTLEMISSLQIFVHYLSYEVYYVHILCLNLTLCDFFYYIE